jgi:hypothetical protein
MSGPLLSAHSSMESATLTDSTGIDNFVTLEGEE